MTALPPPILGACSRISFMAEMMCPGVLTTSSNFRATEELAPFGVRCAAQLPPDRLTFSCAAESIDLARREVRTSDGRVIRYHSLISTIPLRELIRLSGQHHLQPLAEKGLLYSSSNIIGLGLRGRPRAELAKKCWIYFPEDNCPFYRVTVFSNYSPYNVPDITKHWSLMCEVSESCTNQSIRRRFWRR